jgi:hypothetical protein
MMVIGDYEIVRDAATAATTLNPDRACPPDQFLAALVLLRGLREELASWEPQLIAAARDYGSSWAQLAPVLGLASRQAAERRYLRLRPTDTDTAATTGEQRVQAERDRRAADRVVTGWARDNAATLRSLAGRVGAHDTDVHDALADNDPTALLAPLTHAHQHLQHTHPDLAAEITTLTDHTTRLRHPRDEIHARPEPAGETDARPGER